MADCGKTGKPVYLDFNATTPVDPEVIKSITGALVDGWGNPSSTYSYGDVSRALIEKSRKSVASMISCHEEDIIFTSSGTEANNIALNSAILIGEQRLKSMGPLGLSNSTASVVSNFKPHVICSSVEHDSVKKFLVNCVQQERLDLSLVNVDKTGRVDPASVEAEITDRTCLISIMHANNESGVIMPISEIGSRLNAVNSERHSKNLPHIYFHSDAAQSVGKLNVQVNDLGVDYLTIVGHKFHGPRFACLYVKNLMTSDVCKLHSMFYGGGQERGFRSGTENTPMIVGLGVACDLVYNHLPEYIQHMKLCKKMLWSSLKERLPDVVENFEGVDQLPNTLSLRLPPDFVAKEVLDRCKNRLCASVGAACHSNSGNAASGVLVASGLSENHARRTIRFSVGRTTTEEDIKLAAEIIHDTLMNLKS